MMTVLFDGPDQFHSMFVSALKNQLTSYIRAIHELASRQKLASGKLILPARDMGRVWQVCRSCINICDQMWQAERTDLSQVHLESYPFR
jgi:hypothetical protein